ncbi:MAG: hypothetical protein Q4F05_17435 [bacterium]|nr:hypothetical protein [bacterium]
MKTNFLFHMPSGKEAAQKVTEEELNLAINKAVKLIVESDAILIGGGSGLSSSCGYNYYHQNEFFNQHFKKYQERYGFENLYAGLAYPYSTQEEQWDFLSYYVDIMQKEPVGKAYEVLKNLISNKDYFILTTNIDTQFHKIFPGEKLFTFQGDVQYLQCSQPCHDDIYRNIDLVNQMRIQASNYKIPYESIPRCPHCGRQMSLWVRDDAFLEGKQWKQEMNCYQEFLNRNLDKKIVLLELGVGDMTPSIIKFPFWEMAQKWENANLISVNFGKTSAPKHIEDKTVVVCSDIQEALIKMEQEKVLNSISNSYTQWYEFMNQNVDFWLKDSEIHTKSHCGRVMLYALMIGAKKHLTEEELEVLAQAAAFHDSRRQDDWLDVGHGGRAAVYYKDYCQKNSTIRFDERTKQIMAYHDQDDKLSILKLKKIEKENPGVVLLYQIFKDADALDRFRLGENGLDVRYLRTDEARELYQFAKMVWEDYGKRGVNYEFL